MRAINRARLRAELPQTWVQTADDKTTALQKEYDEFLQALNSPTEEGWKEKMILFFKDKKTQAVWQDKDLKAALMRVSSGKCWYCEAQVAERGDNAVDHFRPKGRVAEASTHAGYWWLAFKWQNYRFACTFCNSARLSDDGSGGKQDHFRLWKEEARARTPKDSVDGEQPLLLDPLEPDDTGYITFDKDGTAVSAHSKQENEYLYECAMESIKVYHLNRQWIREHRRKLIASLDEQLDNAERAYRLWRTDHSAAGRLAYRNALDALRSSIEPDAQFSGAARAFLGSRRGTSQVANALLQV